MKQCLSLLPLMVILLIGCDFYSNNDVKIYHYTVSYFGNGNDSGNIPVDNNIYREDSFTTVLDKGTLEKSGSTFLSWNTKPDGTGTSYNPGDIITIDDYILLFAIWSPANTVTFNSNGGSEIRPLAVQSGNKITKPEDPIKDNYSFEGWHKDEQYNESWDFDNDVVTGDITLYAKWNNIQYSAKINITNCYYNSNTDQINIYWDISDRSNLAHIDLYVNGTFYYSYGETDIGAYLPASFYNAMITVKIVDSAGNSFDEVDYQIEFTDLSIFAIIYQVIPSASVIKKYSSGVIDPPVISCSQKGTTSFDEIVETNKTLKYITSEDDEETLYTGPITVGEDWEWIEFRLYNGRTLVAKDDIPVLSDGPLATHYELVPSVNIVIKQGSTGVIDPPIISCLQEVIIGNNAPVPSYKTLVYTTSANMIESAYAGPVTIEWNWTWIKFYLYDGTTLLDWETVPILGN